jgi:hypothetical protein
MQSNYDRPGFPQRLKPKMDAVYRRHECLLHPERDTATKEGKISYVRVDADWRKRPEPEEILRILPGERE